MYTQWKHIFLLLICSLLLRGSWYDVCIDPGHCGDLDPGAPGVNGSAEPDESDFNLDIALVCEGDLSSLGWSVILTRHTEHYTVKKLRPWHKDAWGQISTLYIEKII